jgi:organic hydroperoxide reductase OsmC/OhrA
MTTFLALAAKARLEVVSYRSSASGVLDKTAEGLRFTAMRLRVALQVPRADIERSRQLVHTAHKHCIVSNALKIGVEIEDAVTAPEDGNAGRGSVAP